MLRSEEFITILQSWREHRQKAGVSAKNRKYTRLYRLSPTELTILDFYQIRLLSLFTAFYWRLKQRLLYIFILTDVLANGGGGTCTAQMHPE